MYDDERWNIVPYVFVILFLKCVCVLFLLYTKLYWKPLYKFIELKVLSSYNIRTTKTRYIILIYYRYKTYAYIYAYTYLITYHKSIKVVDLKPSDLALSGFWYYHSSILQYIIIKELISIWTVPLILKRFFCYYVLCTYTYINYIET